MRKISITLAFAASLSSAGLAGGFDIDLVPIADCAEMPCTFRIKTETRNGPLFTPPLPFTSDTDSRDFVQKDPPQREAGTGYRWWSIGVEYDAVDISIGDTFLVFGERVFVVEQRVGFETVQQAHILYQLTDNGFHLIVEFEDGIGFPHSSDLKLSECGFQFFDMFADYGTDKGYQIKDQQAVVSTYKWQKSNGKISAELVSEKTTMVPY